MRKNLMKRGQLSLGMVPSAILIFVFAVIVGAVGVITVQSFKDTAGTSADINSTLDAGVDTIDNIFDLLPTGGTILVVAVILGILVAGLGVFLFQRGRGGLGGGI